MISGISSAEGFIAAIGPAPRPRTIPASADALVKAMAL